MPTLNLTEEEAETLEGEIWGMVENANEAGFEETAEILEGIGTKLVNLEYDHD